MSLISMMEARLPPGFRFHPRDDELVLDFLLNKVSFGSSASGGGSSLHGCAMLIDVNLNKCDPWDLPAMTCVGGKEWYFFCLRDRKYSTGQRMNRATRLGYWKATGKDRAVSRRGVPVGMRKTLVFYQGKAPKGKKTDWVMHEFRMGGEGDHAPKFTFKEDWVLCRVFYKSRGVTPKPTTATFYNDSNTTSSIPSLATGSFVAFDQAPVSFEEYEQVPCFSNIPLTSPSNLRDLLS